VSQEAPWEHLQAQVYIGGPRSVIDAAIDFSSAITEYLQALGDAVRPSDQPLPEQLSVARELGRTAYRLYLSFLYRASDAANVEVITSTTQEDE
jgi:hypothetical protein